MRKKYDINVRHDLQVHMINDTPTLTFAKSSYRLESEEAERVSVDQVSHPLSTSIFVCVCVCQCLCVCVCVYMYYTYTHIHNTYTHTHLTVLQVSHLLPAGASSASSSMSTHMAFVHSAVKMLQKRCPPFLTNVDASSIDMYNNDVGQKSAINL
jgi:hypothetical protein